MSDLYWQENSQHKTDINQKVQLSVGTFEVGVLAHVTSRMQVPPAVLTAGFFVYKYKTRQLS